MQSINTYINEAFRLRDDTKVKSHKYRPTNFDELREIIENKYHENPSYIDCTDISISGMNTLTSSKHSSYQYFGAFTDLYEVETIDVIGWDLKKIENCNALFFNCTNLRTIKGLENWNTSNVKNMSFMFNYCYELQNIGDLSHWDVSNVKNMSLMFAECNKLYMLGNLRNWKIQNCMSFYRMFYHCTSLQYIGDLNSWKGKIRHADMDEMFKGCNQLDIPEWYKE